MHTPPPPAMDLDALRVFAKVAELASFSRAADQLGLPRARVSTAVQALEARLGTRLLQRTTRSVHLTPDGATFLEGCTQLLADADALQALFQHTPAALQGRLRVDMPLMVARNVVMPRLQEFLQAHPLLQIELHSSDRRVDVVHEGFDCVLRVGTLQDSTLVARPLGQLPQVNCASPAYLQRHGTPLTLADLDTQQHRLVHYAASPDTAVTGFEHMDGVTPRVHPLPAAVTVNNTETYHAACLAGLGLVQVPRNGIVGLLAQGALVEVLPGFVPPALPMSLLVAHRHHVPKRVLAFMDWLALVLQPYLASGSATPTHIAS